MPEVKVLKFSTVWCGPCKMYDPIVNQVVEHYSNNPQVVIEKIDADQQPDLSLEYGVRSVPTTIFLKDGQQVDKLVGAQQKNKLIEKIDSLLV